LWRFETVHHAFEHRVSLRKQFLLAALVQEDDLDRQDAIIHEINNTTAFRKEIDRVRSHLIHGINQLTRPSDSAGAIDDFYQVSRYGWTCYCYIDMNAEVFIATLAVHEDEPTPNSLRQTLQDILYKARLP
jgi:hypothetical protein